MHKANAGFVGSYSAAHSEVVAAHGDHKVGVWLVKTGQNLNKGAFSRAILAHQSMYFAFFNIECDVIEGHLAGKSLRKRMNMECCSHCSCLSPMM